MPNTYYPNKDADFVSWLANFLTVANVNLIPLGLIAGDLTPITTLQPTYSTNLYDISEKSRPCLRSGYQRRNKGFDNSESACGGE